jgi:hypothetical protein
VRALIAALLAGHLLLAALYTSSGISAHLDTDQANATKLRQLNVLCGGPKFKRAGYGVPV